MTKDKNRNKKTISSFTGTYDPPLQFSYLVWVRSIETLWSVDNQWCYFRTVCFLLGVNLKTFQMATCCVRDGRFGSSFKDYQNWIFPVHDHTHLRQAGLALCSTTNQCLSASHMNVLHVTNSSIIETGSVIIWTSSRQDQVGVVTSLPWGETVVSTRGAKDPIMRRIDFLGRNDLRAHRPDILHTSHIFLIIAMIMSLLWYLLILYVDGSVQDCSNSNALATELLQSCAKPRIYCKQIKPRRYGCFSLKRNFSEPFDFETSFQKPHLSLF